MRFTLYSQGNHSLDNDNQCGVAVEVHWQPSLLREALKAGELTPEQVADTLTRAVKSIAEILSEFKQEKLEGPTQETLLHGDR